MAAITPVVTNLAAGSKLVTWTQINQDDTGDELKSPVPGHTAAVIYVTGTFDTGVYTLEESLDDGATWNEAVSLGGSIAGGSDLDFSAAGAAAVTIQAEARYRIAVAGGTTEDIDVSLFLLGIGA